MMTQKMRSDHRQIVQEYLENHDPYEPATRLGYRIADMSRYAEEKGCRIADLTAAEAERFAVV